MLKSKRMSRLLIAASKDQLETVVRELYRHNIFHVEDFVEKEEEGYEGFKIGMPLEGASETSSELLRIRSVINTFGIKPESLDVDTKQASSAISSRIERDLQEIEHEVEALVERRNGLENSVRVYEQKISELEPFTTLTVDLALYRGYDNFAVLAGHIPADINLLVPNEKFFTDAVPGNLYIAVVPQESQEEAENFLLNADFQQIPIPDEVGSAEERIQWYTQEITRLTTEIGQIDERINAQKEKHTEFLVACDELLTAEVEKAEVPLRFATTEETFVAEGWVPSDKSESLIADLRKVTEGKIFVTEVEVDLEKDSVPVEYNNPGFSHPTELLMDVYSRPKYTEIDPTLLVSIVFPLFFGMILGDVGYGLILLAMSFGLRKYMKGEGGKQLLDTLRNASISSIIFGLIYSEFIGYALPWDPLVFSRHLNIGGAHAGGHGPDAPEMLIISIWIGILHISLGRIFSIINHANQDHGAHRTKAIFGNLGWLFTMWGILMMIWSMFPIPFMPDFTALPIMAAGLNGAALVGAVMILIGLIGIGQENVLDLMEVPTIISHVLSYARLVAVGLSSVAIAMVTNYIAIGLIIEPAIADFGIVSIILIICGIIVFLLGHALNTGLGILGGGLHSIRLHYVEFFTKFYQGGGIKFNPFGMKKKFTED